MSVFVYNGVEISFVHTQRVSETTVRSEDGADALYRRVEISISGVVSKYPVAPALVGESATAAYTRVRELLWIPRKQLTFTVNGETLVSSPAAGRSLDVNNGPMPLHLDITRVDGDQALHVDYCIETFLACGDVAVDPVVSNRWQEECEVDSCGYSTWTRRGKVVARSDLLAISADDLRALILPPLRDGFRRLPSKYTLQSDGLALSYVVTDKETPIGAPAPAFEAEGEVTISAMNQAVRIGEVRVRLKGNYYSNVDLSNRTPGMLVEGKAALLKTAVSIAMWQLGKLDLVSRKHITAAVVRTSLYANDCEVMVKGRLAVAKGRNEGLASSMDGLTGPPLYSDALSADPGSRGSAGLSLLAAALKDPCLSLSSLNTVGFDEPSESGGTALYTPAEIDFTDVIPDDYLDKYKDAVANDSTGFWTTYTINKSYRMDPGVMQLPVAKSLGSGLNTSVFVQTHPKQAQLTTDWVVERAGSRPTLPSTNLQDGGNSVLVSADILTDELQLSGDGVTDVWKVTGRYVHGFKDSAKAQVTWGTVPYRDSLPGGQMTAIPADLVTGIIDPYGGASQAQQSVLTSLPGTST